MSNLEAMVGWFADLNAVVVEQNLEADPDILRQLSGIEIELSGMSVNLPDQLYGVKQGAVKQALLRLHSQRVADQVLDVLQSVLGYYNLPDQPRGANEPIIGSTISRALKSKLVNNEFDVFEVKMNLALLLEGSGKRPVE